MKKVVVYNEKWHETCIKAFDEELSKYTDDFMGLSPDNTIFDLLSMLAEVYFKAIIGEEYLDMTIGELMKMSDNEAIEKLVSIFNTDERGFTETYRPVV